MCRLVTRLCAVRIPLTPLVSSVLLPRCRIRVLCLIYPVVSGTLLATMMLLGFVWVVTYPLVLLGFLVMTMSRTSGPVDGSTLLPDMTIMLIWRCAVMCLILDPIG